VTAGAVRSGWRGSPRCSASPVPRRCRAARDRVGAPSHRALDGLRRRGCGVGDRDEVVPPVRHRVAEGEVAAQAERGGVVARTHGPEHAAECRRVQGGEREHRAAEPRPDGVHGQRPRSRRLHHRLDLRPVAPQHPLHALTVCVVCSPASSGGRRDPCLLRHSPKSARTAGRSFGGFHRVWRSASFAARGALARPART
jgi:hypothetical protein